MAWRVSACSERGPVRSEQQDRHLEGRFDTPWGRRLVVAVFDGMGGIPRGREAAAAAVDALPEAVAQPDMRGTLQRLNEAVLPTGGGTTAVVAVLDAGSVRLGGAGDSAAYLFRGGEAKLLLPKDAVGPASLTDFLGRRGCRGHVRDVPVRPGDAVLLCTDGVDGVLGRGDLERHLVWDHPLARMFDAIRTAGMPDNATAVLASHR